MSDDIKNPCHDITTQDSVNLNDTLESVIVAKRYVLKHKLGKGGSALVYLANDSESKTDVAIKLKVRKNPVSLRKEARITSEVKSKYVPQIFGFGTENELDYLVMQYIDGKTLKQAHDPKEDEEKKDLTFENKTRIMTDVANALDIAHSKGYIHNDVKPTNILLQVDSTYLIDWGIAIHCCEEQCKSPKEHVLSTEDTTTDSVVKGTLMYMSPEQVMGEVSSKSDVYSLGAVAYELFTNNRFRNFVSGNQALVLAELVSRKGFVNFKAPNLPAPLTDLIMGALNPEPANRPTAKEFANSFASYTH